jgi:hypothetical protein
MSRLRAFLDGMSRTFAITGAPIRSRPATLSEVGVPDAPRRCPNCRHKIGGRFSAVYTGTPAAKTLVGWMCLNCRTEFNLSSHTRP